MATADERGFLKAIKEKPDDVATRLAYADWLEEQARPLDAVRQRAEAGVSEVQYRLRRKSDGLFSDGGENAPVRWVAQGKAWRKREYLLSHLRGHLKMYRSHYGHGTPWDDLEICVFEVRPQLVVTLSFSVKGESLVCDDQGGAPPAGEGGRP